MGCQQASDDHYRRALGNTNGGIVVRTEVEHGFDTMYIAANEIHEIQLGVSALFLAAVETKDIIHFISRPSDSFGCSSLEWR